MAEHSGSPRDLKVLLNGDRGGLLLRILARNVLWREAVYEMTRHLPPSGAELNMLVVDEIGALDQQFHVRRPDLKITTFPFPAPSPTITFAAVDNSYDAVAAQSVLISPEMTQSFLRETLRVLRPGGRVILLHPSKIGSMINPLRLPKFPLLLWNLRIPAKVKKTLVQTQELLVGMGYERVLSENILDGYGILSRGEKPYTDLSNVERISKTAALDVIDDHTAQIIEPQELNKVSRGRFIFLLVQQTPNKPAWSIKADEALRWRAAMISDAHTNNQPYMLAFTSLPKAVEFMQSAVTSGKLQGINKVAKFDKTVAIEWPVSLFVNPTFEAIQNSGLYVFRGDQLDVDPRRAAIGEE